MRLWRARDRIRYGFPSVEFCADVESIARTTLDSTNLKIFQRYHLQQRSMPRDQRSLYHNVYAIEEVLGAAFIASDVLNYFRFETLAWDQLDQRAALTVARHRSARSAWKHIILSPMGA